MSWHMPWKKQRPEALAAVAQRPDVSLLSDKGCKRPTNEDSGRVVDANNGANSSRGLLVVVADGMGGHEAGEIASQLATDTVATVYPIAGGTPGQALAEAFRQAHETIFHRASHNHALKGMGSTCTAVAIVGNQAWAAHVGDSRLYLLRGQDIYQLSEDHSAIMEMVRQGLISEEEAAHHEDRNVLLRAMGTQPILDLVSWPEPMDVKPQDIFLLCSDGLYNLVSDSEINAVVRNASPEGACRKLVEMANDRGGHDNITVAIIAMPSGTQSPQHLKDTREAGVHP